MSCAPTASGPRGLAVFFTVFVPFALAHFLSLLLRNANAVLAPFLAGSLALDAGQLGLLTSAFFLAVVLAQLPVGAAIDRYGSRKSLLVLLLIAACGALLFARGGSFVTLMLARAMMGFGVGGTLLAGVKGIAPWLAPSKLPSLHGYLIAAGGLGAATATLPVRLVLDYTDWRGLFVLLAIVTALAALLVWFVTPRHQHRRPPPQQPLLPSLMAVLRHRRFREVTGLVLVSHTVFLGLQGLWIGRWLTDIGQLSESAVAYLLYLTMAGVIFGAIGVGIVTEWAGRRAVTALDVGACGVGLFIVVQLAMAAGYVPSFPALAVLFALIGTITGIEYTVVAQSMPPELGSRASACLNMLIFLGACLVQAGFGQIIAQWTPDSFGHYPAAAYSTAFGLLALLQLPCVLAYAWRRLRARSPAATAAAVNADEHLLPVAARG